MDYFLGLFDTSPRLENSQDQSEEEKKLASHVRSKVEEVRASADRIAHEAIWMTNTAYLLGYDGLTYNTATRQFQPINRASAYLKKNRIHVNKILPTIQNRLAKLCKSPPGFDVRPESNSDEDKEAARLSLQVLDSFWCNLKLNEKRIPLYMWVQQAGHAWVKVSWDPTLGKPMVDPMSNEFSYEGDVRVDIVSPFEVFPDPMAKTYDDLSRSWVIHAKVRKLDYFKANYPERGHLVKEEDAWLLSAQYEQRINSLNARGPSSSGMQTAMKNSAIEMIKYEARCKDYPNGRMIVVANGIVLENRELPVGEIPFAKFDDVVIGGKFYSESIITHLRPIQDQFNETIRRRAEWTRKLLAGKYRAARGSGIAQEALNDESGEVIYYDTVPNAPGGGGPEQMQVPIIPQYAYQEEDRLNEMFNDISGISEISRGTLPSASIPAIGMQLLIEQDDTRVGVMTEQHEHAWATVGSLILKYFEVGYVMPRKLKMSGKSLEYTVKEIKGEDILGNTDVTVIRGSTLPGSKTLKRQEIMNIYGQGLLGDPNDTKVREKVLGMLEFGDVAEAWEDFGIDQNQITRGIALLEQGIPVQVDELDNHDLWMLELNRYRKSDKWDNLPPEIQALFRETIEAHIQTVMKISNMIPPEPPPISPELMNEMSGTDPVTGEMLPEPPNEPLPPDVAAGGF